MTTPEIQTSRHPIRGALYGLLIGLSAAYLLFFEFTVFGFDTLAGVITRFVIIVVAGILLGIVWAYVAPAKKPDGPPPEPAAAVAEPDEAAYGLHDPAAEPVVDGDTEQTSSQGDEHEADDREGDDGTDADDD